MSTFEVGQRIWMPFGDATKPAPKTVLGTVIAIATRSENVSLPGEESFTAVVPGDVAVKWDDDFQTWYDPEDIQLAE